MSGHKIIDGLKQAIGYAQGRREAHEWQPIDTAPKRDGEAILAFDPLGDARVVIWWDSDHWVVAWDGSRNDDCTHWMPLPPPPHSSAMSEKP